MIKFNILTLFPEVFPGILQHGLLGKALSKNHFEINTINIRDYSNLSANSVDDKPFSGGAGMVLRPDIISKSIEANFNKDELDSCNKICFSAKGKKLTQNNLTNYNLNQNFILLNGRYEGIDQRVRELFVDQEISIGDYVLMGGELPALVICESIIRLLPGSMNNSSCALSDSFQDNLLAPPIYTRPANFKGHTVPEILLSGNEQKISQWRENQSIIKTKDRRPDLLK